MGKSSTVKESHRALVTSLTRTSVRLAAGLASAAVVATAVTLITRLLLGVAAGVVVLAMYQLLIGPRAWRKKYPSARPTKDKTWWRRWAISLAIREERNATPFVVAILLLSCLIVVPLGAFETASGLAVLDLDRLGAGLLISAVGVGHLGLRGPGLIVRLQFRRRHGRPPNEDDIAVLNRQAA